MKSWKRLEPTIVSKVGYRTIVTKIFQLPNGIVDHFETIDAEDKENVCVIALTPDNKVIVARQFRIGPEMVMDEIPGGFVDPGEDKETAVRRELLEETGYEVGELTYLGAPHYDTYTNSKRHCFLATDCKPGKDGAKLGEHEDVELLLMPIKDFLTMTLENRMTDPGAVLLAYNKLKELEAND